MKTFKEINRKIANKECIAVTAEEVIEDIDETMDAMTVIDNRIWLWKDVLQILRADIPSRLITKGMI